MNLLPSGASAMIWRFQDDFVEGCTTLLTGTLRILDCQLYEKLFLVGVNLQTNEVTIVPNDTHLAQKVQDNLDDLKDKFVPYPDDSQHDNTAWKTQYAEHDRSVWKCRADINDALKQGLATDENFLLVSPCSEVNGHLVAVATTFSISAHNAYPGLGLAIYSDSGRWPSLHFGAIDAALERASQEMAKKDVGRDSDFPPELADDTVRVAARFFTRLHSWHGKRFSQLDINFRGTIEPFHVYNQLAAMTYERQVGSGGLLIADAGHSAVDVAIKLDLPIMTNQRRRLRKLLQLCKGGLSILTDSRYVWGVGSFVRDRYDESKCDVFNVNFTGSAKWEMCHLDKVLMQVEYGEPRVPHAFEIAEVERRILDRFPNHGSIRHATLPNLLEIVRWILDARCGTMLVISTMAETESERLAGKFGQVSTFEPTRESIVGAAAIDGAIMIDVMGMCHGIGLLLDGVAGSGEAPERGARYNSAVRYTNGDFNAHAGCHLAIVISDDGMIDILPANRFFKKP
jgi:hypothetical protein